MARIVNYRACFDGARRGGGESAAGVAIFAYHINGRRALLYRGGKPLDNLGSAFVAEALALEWCFELLDSYADAHAV